MKISFLWLSPALTAVGSKLGIDAHYYAKNVTLVLLGHAVSILRGIITGYFVVRFFQKEVYGEYQFLLSVVGMLSFLGLPGLAQSVTRAWARGDSFSLAEMTKQQLKVCVIGSLLLLGSIPFLQFYGRGELWLAFFVAALLFPLPPIAMVRFGGFTVGRARFDIALKATIVWSALTIVATLAIIFFHQSSLLMLITTMSIPSLVYLYAGRNLRPPAEGGPQRTRAIWRYSLQLTVATLPIDLVWYLDKLLISYFFGLSQLATFSVALLIPEQARIFIKQFLPVSFAKQAAGKDNWQRRRKLLQIVLVGTVLFALGIGFYVILCPWMIPLLFPQYDAKEIILLTSVAAVTLITNPGTLFAQYLEAQGLIREVRLSNWIAAAGFGVSLFLLIPTMGLLGAVLARGVFRFIAVGTSCWFILRTPPREGSVGVPVPRRS